jgi:bone morphogenetic protein receptor type-2
MASNEKVLLCLTVIAFVYLDVVRALAGNGTYCAFVNNKVMTQPETGEPIVVSNTDSQLSGSNSVDMVSFVRCQEDREYCYTLWYIDTADRTKNTVLMQGCWDHPDTQECPEPNCVARSALSQRNIRNNTRFCCCRGSLCNINVTDTVNLTAIDIMARQQAIVAEFSDPNYSFRTIVIALSSVVAVAIVIFVVFTSVRLYLSHRHADDFDETGCESSAAFLGGSESASAASGYGGCTGSELDGLKIDVLISHGRYGDVYKGWLGSSEVAIKILSAAQYRCFANELDVLTLPLMHHPNVIQFRGCRDETLPGAGRRLMIVTTYEPLGSLTDYLKNNTVDWSTACRMCHSVATGLAHLHTEFDDGDITKPPVAHRDVNSRNILVKSDLTCCLCDFGFAMKIPTIRITEAGTNDDRASLADVGTLRYMAPEVLEGSVNLYDCRMALTQVDVYALGLVFWEIGTRCHELYQGLPTPEYQLPFEAEIGPHPTFEDMQVAVSRNKLRPAFPDMWKDTNLAIKALRDTIEECWDHDAEARISAVCAEERTREMAVLWEMRFKGLTPTVHLKDLEEKVNIQRNRMTSDSVESSSVDCNEPPASRSSIVLGVDGTTSVIGSKADCNIDLQKSGGVAPPLTLRNAQNPTVERNTHRRSSEELAIEGNTLVVRRTLGSGNIPGTVVAPLSVDGGVRNASSASSATSNRPLSALRPDQLQRIAYVQNAMEPSPPTVTTTGSSASVEPKRQNVPSGNGAVDGVPSEKAGQQVHGLVGHPCEVLYLEGAAVATVVRPSSLPLDAHRSSLASSNLNVKPANVEVSMAHAGAEPSAMAACRPGSAPRAVRMPTSNTGHGMPVAASLQLANGPVAKDGSITHQPPVHGIVKPASLYLQDSAAIGQRCAIGVGTVIANGSVPSLGHPCSDNFGYESSTSPRFDARTASEASCEV